MQYLGAEKIKNFQNSTKICSLKIKNFCKPFLGHEENVSFGGDNWQPLSWMQMCRYNCIFIIANEIADTLKNNE